MFTLRFPVFGLVCTTLLVGCNNGPAELSKKNEVVSWSSLEDLRKPEIGMGIFRSAQMGDEETLKKTLADPKVEEFVKAFESDPIPKKYASKAREDAKAAVVTEFKLLLSTAKMGASFDDLKRSADALLQNIGKLTDPALK